MTALVLFAFLRSDEGGEPSNTPSGVPSVSASAVARDIAKRVTLTPKDWGSSFVQASPYEDSTPSWMVAGQDCQSKATSLVNAIDYLSRDATESETTAYASSALITLKGADSAGRAVAEQRDSVRRCPKQWVAGSETENIHEVDVPDLKGFDDLVAEEGHDVGGGLDDYYTSLTASKGQFVLQSYVSRSGFGTRGQNRKEAVRALSLMLSRLESS
ncbi:hypothetical protein ACGFOU_05540 [Streptomyces sp. NPDC048595]|uniref:hypothetical protein n=1 Tax=Streptomyces sp. NPDC048595 TaxID=3365576 RepID=UPI003711A318